MGTEADTNLLRNPLPKEWHPASLHPSIPKYLKPTPGASPQLPGQPVSVGEGLRGTPAEGGCGDGGSGPPPAAGARSHTRVLQPHAGEGSATQPVGARSGAPHRAALLHTPSPHMGPGTFPHTHTHLRLPLPCLELGLAPAWHPRPEQGTSRSSAPESGRKNPEDKVFLLPASPSCMPERSREGRLSFPGD